MEGTDLIRRPTLHIDELLQTSAYAGGGCSPGETIAAGTTDGSLGSNGSGSRECGRASDDFGGPWRGGDSATDVFEGMVDDGVCICGTSV